MEALTSAGHAIIAEKNNLDAGCKEIFGCKDMAAFVVKNCIPEYKNLSLKKISGLISDNMEVGSHAVDDIPKEAEEQEADDPSSDDSPEKIEEKKNESKSTNEGTISFDVLFDLKLPRKRGSAKVIVDIEAQNNPNPGYPLLSRGDFYVARLVSEQKERVFHRSHYEKIQKVYSIWICISPEANRRGILNRYELREECLVGDYHFKRNEYDKFCVVMVGLGDKNSSNELIKVLSTIFDAKISGENKIELAKEHGIRVTDNFEKGVNSMCSYSEIVFKQGTEEGRAEGRAEERTASIWQIMKKLNFSFEKAADVLDIPKKERAEFRTAVNELALKESEK